MGNVNGVQEKQSLSPTYVTNNDAFVASFAAYLSRGQRYNQLFRNIFIGDSWHMYSVPDRPYGLGEKLGNYYTGAPFNNPNVVTNVSKFYRSVWAEDEFTLGTVTNHLDPRNGFKGDLQTSALVNNEQPNPNPSGGTPGSTLPWCMNSATQWGPGRGAVKACRSTQCSMVYFEGGPSTVAYNPLTVTNGVPGGPAKLLDLVHTCQASSGFAFDWAIFQNATTGSTIDGRTINGVTTATCGTQVTAIKADVTAAVHSNATASLTAGVGTTDCLAFGAINQAVFGTWNGTSWTSTPLAASQLSQGVHTGWLNAGASNQAIDPTKPYVLVLFTRVNNAVYDVFGVVTGVDEMGPYASPYLVKGVCTYWDVSCGGAGSGRFRDFARPVAVQSTMENTQPSRQIVPLEGIRRMTSGKALGGMSANFSHTGGQIHFITITMQNSCNSGELDFAGQALTGSLTIYQADLQSFATMVAAGYTDENGNVQPYLWTHIEIPYVKANASYTDWKNGVSPFDVRGAFDQWVNTWDTVFAATPGIAKTARRIDLGKAINKQTWAKLETLGLTNGPIHLNDAGHEWILKLVKQCDAVNSIIGITP